MYPADLVAHWRTRADDLERFAPAAAEAFRDAATDLENALRDADELDLSLQDAARESGYSDRHLRSLIASGDIPNVGRPGKPRIRRADLPRKTTIANRGTYDPSDHARSIMGRLK